jgi:hypothetical protein
MRFNTCLKTMIEKYVLVQWPYSQIVMEHPRFNECYALTDLDNQDVVNSAYFIPEDLYAELKDEIGLS